jgi:hypothetical protein
MIKQSHCGVSISNGTLDYGTYARMYLYTALVTVGTDTLTGRSRAQGVNLCQSICPTTSHKKCPLPLKHEIFLAEMHFFTRKHIQNSPSC